MLKSARNSTVSWRDLDQRHHLHPFTDYRALAEEGGSRIIVRGKGAWLEDSEGNRILDGMAGLWCVNIGYGREELAEAAYRQMLELPYYNTFFKTATPPSIELAERLVALMPQGFDHVFYGSSGSEGNDTIVRLVRRYWDLMGRPNKKTFISRELAYHGSTIAGASLGGQAAMHAQGGLLPGVEHVMPPYRFAFGGDLSEEAFCDKAVRAIEDKIIALGADNVAAFIGEPIMGAGGVIIPPKGYWPEVQRICRKHDVLLVIDEVISGFGRIGHWCASEHYGLKPDLMTLAKGITSGYVPLSAVMIRDRIAQLLIEEGGEFFHGYTYSGHPVACAVALENIRILEEEGIITRVREETGPYLQARLREALADHPMVGEVRGLGFLAAIELVKDKNTREPFEPVGKVGTKCRECCFANGLVMRAVRDTMLLSPPLILSKEDVDELVKRAQYCIDLTAKDLGLL